MPKFLSPSEVASILNVSDQTIVAMCKKDELPHVKIGKQYRIDKDAVEKLIGRPLEGFETNE